MVRISKSKRLAIVVLFREGLSAKTIARLFAVPKADVEQVLRAAL